MEFPDLGEHCSEESCQKLDFLPLKCDACENVFCREHIAYKDHNCSSAYKKDVQVPVCPLCNTPIPMKRDEMPDIVVGRHIDNDCQSDPAKNKRTKVFSNKCSVKGCKIKEVIPFICDKCKLNFCLKHRHETDHKCEGKEAAARKRAKDAALERQKAQNGGPSHPQNNGPVRSSLLRDTGTQSRSKPRTTVTEVQGSMSEDEALARALALSMQEANQLHQPSNTLSNDQIQNDFTLARALYESEQQTAPARSSQNKCSVS